MSAFSNIASPPIIAPTPARTVALCTDDELDGVAAPKSGGAKLGVPNKKCMGCDFMNWPSARRCKECDAEFIFKNAQKPAKKKKAAKVAKEKPDMPEAKPVDDQPLPDGDPFKLPDFACGLTDKGHTYLTWPNRGDYIVLSAEQAALVAKVNGFKENP